MTIHATFFSSTCHLQNTLLFWCLHCLLYYSLLPVKLLPVLCAVILEQSLMCFIVFWIRGIRVLVLTASQSGCFCWVWPSVLTYAWTIHDFKFFQFHTAHIPGLCFFLKIVRQTLAVSISLGFIAQLMYAKGIDLFSLSLPERARSTHTLTLTI